MSNPVRFAKMPVEWCRERLQYREGLVFSEIPSEYEAVFQGIVLKEVVQVFPDLTKFVSLFYLFDMDAQPTDSNFGSADGVRTLRYLQSGAAYVTIGLAIQTLDVGILYSQSVLLHELTHVLVLDDGSHSELFYAVLNILIRLFNMETGSGVVNDYNRGMDSPQRRHRQ